MSTKASCKSPRDTQAKNVAALGGMPPKKDVAAIAKANTPGARKSAPDSFRPK